MIRHALTALTAGRVTLAEAAYMTTTAILAGTAAGGAAFIEFTWTSYEPEAEL